jgi:hypothetical protein
MQGHCKMQLSQATFTEATRLRQSVNSLTVGTEYNYTNLWYDTTASHALTCPPTKASPSVASLKWGDVSYGTPCNDDRFPGYLMVTDQ